MYDGQTTLSEPQKPANHTALLVNSTCTCSRSVDHTACVCWQGSPHWSKLQHPAADEMAPDFVVSSVAGTWWFLSDSRWWRRSTPPTMPGTVACLYQVVMVFQPMYASAPCCHRKSGYAGQASKKFLGMLHECIKCIGLSQGCICLHVLLVSSPFLASLGHWLFA